MSERIIVDLDRAGKLESEIEKKLQSGQSIGSVMDESLAVVKNEIFQTEELGGSATIDVDSIVDGSTSSYTGATTTNKISLTDNLADALNITEGSNSYLKFVTSDGSEEIVFGKNSTFSGTLSAATGSSIGNLTLSNGSITDTSGDISFDTNDLAFDSSQPITFSVPDTSTGDVVTFG